MPLIELEKILIEKRQRSEMDKQKLSDLKDSILNKGLLHAPVLEYIGTWSKDYTYRLVAGERRLRAVESIFNDGLTFNYDGSPVIPGMLPFTTLQQMSADDLYEAELDENLMREDLSWQDKTRALADLQKRRMEQNPEQTVLDTARELAEKAGDQPGMSESNLRKQIADAEIVAPYLNDPAIAKARNLQEAKSIVLKREHTAYQAQLIKANAAEAKKSSVRCELRLGDALQIMPQLDPEQFDLILTDPPYGIGADSDSYATRTEIKHNYDDRPETARNILQSIIIEGWRLAKTKANLFIFTDYEHFEWMRELAGRMGWSVWRKPLIWQKSKSEGLAPWKNQGFIYTWDCLFWATKGQRGIQGPFVDILPYDRVLRGEREHAAEKPAELLNKLIELATSPGDTVFDPCAGSATTLMAAKRMHRNSIGIELDSATYDAALVRIHSTAEGTDVRIPLGHDPFTGLPDV